MIEKKPDGTIEIKISLKWTLVKKERDLVVEEMSKTIDLPGFRKGKAPKKLVEEKLDKAKINDEIIRKLLPVADSEIIKENNLRPIIDPQIHIDGELEEGKDWLFHAITCEMPEVDLMDIKLRLKKSQLKVK